MLQYNLNLAKVRADFSISKAIANIYNCTDFIEIIIGNLRKLREKIDDDIFKTIKGVGYKIEF